MWSAIVAGYRNPTPTSLNRQQAVNQIVFLLCGKLFLHIGVTWAEIAAAVVCGAIVDNVALRVRLGAWQPFNLPSLVAPFAVCIMLRSDRPWVLPLAATVGLLSKHVARIDGRHFHNPSNVAVLFGLLLFPADTTIQRLDWGHVPWMVGVIAVAGLLLTTRARVFENSVLYHAIFVAMLWTFVTKNPDRIRFAATNGSVLLYSFFIQNDPRVLPRARLFRFAFVLMAAAGQVVLQLTWGPKDVNTGLALFAASMLVPLYRRAEERWSSPTSKRVLATFAYAAPLAGLVALYGSDFNFKRNLRESITAAKVNDDAVAAKLERAFVEVPWRERDAYATEAEQAATIARHFSGTRDELYATAWTEPHAVRVPFTATARAPFAFDRVRGVFDTRDAVPGPPWYGYDVFSFASVTAGDIDHDGRLDVVLGSVAHGLSVYLNEGEGRFAEVTAAILEGGALSEVEHAALVDLDSDGWLDLVVARSHYRGVHASGAWRFDPASRQFRATSLRFGGGKRNAGGFGFVDLNRDRTLDFYVSYGVDYATTRVNFVSDPGRDEFLLSHGRLAWRDALATTFSARMTEHAFVGMTPLFAHVNDDAAIDFLLGNDYNHPSMLAFGDGARFTLAPKETVAVNTRNSMSYFPIDLDGDGALELWENGIGFDYSTAWVEGLIAERSTAPMSRYDDELVRYMVGRVKGKFPCETFTDPRVIGFCRRDLTTRKATVASAKPLCAAHVNPAEIGRCTRDLREQLREETFDPSMGHYDVEIFPKKFPENSLLRRDASTGRYERVRLGRDVEYTGWSWAAFPFDLDNDGREDLHVATGFVDEAHNRNRLLLNGSTPGTMALRDVASTVGVDVLDDGRGTVVADFDGDGDGDVLVNGVLTQPVYWRNRTGGRALEIELRSQRSNYYALGSRVVVRTNRRMQTRQVWSGGIWGSYPPAVLHFGLTDDERIEDVVIEWPDGHREHRVGLEPGARWVVFE